MTGNSNMLSESIDRIEKSSVPTLLITTVCGELCVRSGWVPKSSDEGARLATATGTATASPEREMVSGVPSLVVTVSVPVLAPTAIGANFTSTLHCPPFAARPSGGVGQVLKNWNGPLKGIIGFIVSITGPRFVIVAV